MRIVVVGLEGAGKSTVLKQLRLGAVFTIIPTIGLNVEVLEYGNLRFWSWDPFKEVHRYSSLAMQKYYRGINGVIYVVDSCDRGRICDARNELVETLGEDELHGAPLLVLANKQDRVVGQRAVLSCAFRSLAVFCQ